MRRLAILPTFLILILGLTLSDTRPLAQSAGRSLVPAAILDPIIDEYSGEAAFRHVQLLAANRDRQPREYLESFFETTYLREQATDYGLDVAVEYFRSGEIWDAEEADLWLVEPAAKRLAGAFARRQAKKTYWAIVIGNPKPAAGQIDMHAAGIDGPCRVQTVTELQPSIIIARFAEYPEDRIVRQVRPAVTDLRIDRKTIVCAPAC